MDQLQSYVSVFGSNALNAIEELRVPITGYNGIEGVAVDQDGVYVAVHIGGGESKLIGFMPDLSVVRWIEDFTSDTNINIGISQFVVEYWIFIHNWRRKYFWLQGFINVGDSDVITMKYNTSGNFIWLHQFGTTCVDGASGGGYR